MRILVATNKKNEQYKEDTDVFIEALKEQKHKVDRIEFQNVNRDYQGFLNPTVNDYDVVWAPYEREIGLSNLVKQQLKIDAPLVGHYEWVPPWRVGSDPTLWGYTNRNILQNNLEKESFKSYYAGMAKNYLTMCKIKTYVNSYLLNTIKNIVSPELVSEFDKKNEFFEKPYIIDDEQILKEAKESDVKEKYQIMSTARLVPHKRIHHVIIALSLLKNPPKYKVVGDGEELDYLKALAIERGVDVEFVGTGLKGVKTRIIQESLFSVNPWASLPIGESAILKKPAITYDEESMKQKHDKMCVYVENNNIIKLALAIQYWLENDSERKKAGKLAYKFLVEGRTGITTKEEGGRRMSNILKKVIK